MRITGILIIFISFLTQIDNYGQVVRAPESVISSATVLSDQHAKQSRRAIVYRNNAQRNHRTYRTRLNQEMNLTKEANASMRIAREALKAKKIIRKEKSDIMYESCDKKYNSYVQHECYAYNHPTNHMDSILLHRNELTVLLKKKKYHYKVCIDGETYYVLREDNS